MFKHLFKLIWNKKRQNFLLMSEIFVSFMVIFVVFFQLIYYFQDYKKPMGFDYKNVWVVAYNNSLVPQSADSLTIYYKTLRQIIKSMPQVQEISFSSDNFPFSRNPIVNGIYYNKKKIPNINWFTGEDSYKDVLHMDVLEGRWFNSSDAVSKYRPIIINSNLKEKLFGNGLAVGQLISNYDNKNKMKVVGVVQSVKVNGDFGRSEPGIYNRTDTSSFHSMSRILIKVAPGTDATFEGHLYKTLSNFMKNPGMAIIHLSDRRKTVNYLALLPITILSIVSCFLIINVSLGLFGVLWYSINKRRGEIGLRRAVGATGRSVYSQLIVEALILATLSIIVGSFFAIQFPLLNISDLPASIYITALFLSIAFIYLLVFLCSLYPGKQAAAIYPATALHDE